MVWIQPAIPAAPIATATLAMIQGRWGTIEGSAIHQAVSFLALISERDSAAMLLDLARVAQRLDLRRNVIATVGDDAFEHLNSILKLLNSAGILGCSFR